MTAQAVKTRQNPAYRPAFSLERLQHAMKTLLTPPKLFRLTLAVLLLCMCSTHADETARFFQPQPGFTRAKDLPDGFHGKVGAIVFAIKDAFEGATTHSEAEKVLYDVGNKLHINTRQSTIRRRLLFREGDTITADMLRETEKNLRAEAFLADAILEVGTQSDSSLIIKVSTYDQWTTSPAFAVGRKGGKWVWWVGPVESNLFGTGQRLGFFIGHDGTTNRDSRLIDFENTAFTSAKLHLAAQYAWLSDGYFYSFGLSRALLSRTDRWGFSTSANGGESAQDFYLSGNDLDKLKREGKLDSSEQNRLGKTNLLGQWEKISTQNVYAGVTRSFGYSTKISVTPFFEHERNFLKSPIFFLSDPALWDSLGLPHVAPVFNERRDELLGASLTLYQYSYKTVHNFRNLKWSETIATGWSLSGGVAQNQDWLGARNADLRYSYSGAYNDTWKDQLFLNTSAALRYFQAADGGLDNGSTSARAEAQWKPLYYLATVMTVEYDNLFAAKSGQQLELGEESGLIGFPNFYYTGKARALFAAEQRFFPPFEFGTFVPAFAVFINGGNTYSTYDAVNLKDMHYAVGVGLRLGATRSVQKVVNHINVVWPLGEKNLSAWSWGIRASKSL